MKLIPSLSIVVFTASLMGLVACSEQPQQKQSTPMAPVVSVAKVVSERLTEWDEFTGRLQAPQTVEIRPRVSGYIDIVAFKEGEMVKPGEPLFFIDNRPFKAEVKRLEAELINAKSLYTLAKKEYVRAIDLVKKNAISDEILDQRLSTQEQAKARIASVQAQLELAELQLSYTRVTSPIGGRVSNALITRGNYVNEGQSVLTTVVSTDEVHAYFDADEQTFLKYNQLARQGSRPSTRGSKQPVLMALATDEGFPHQGVIDFVDNRINQSSGTIRSRAIFKNENGLLIPGLFARIRLVGSASYQGILIDDRAIGTDLNNKFVLVLDEQNQVNYRPVELGEKLQGLRIIKSGLKAGEKIVVNGLQKVRPGAQVSPKLVEMTSNENLKALQAMQERLDATLDTSVLAKSDTHTAVTGG
ncbi:efflux RND transporter periplasmic adaptor subunit [Alteromonas sp. a30]|uniref:efflux RND transporter periplasmic adaptor subunit n=1 Tax=Alteromonas sp. a30 TaxID=2730917 RepID=UPI0022831823|nr:efflux RND transporter periplasmic adaptor subunit [Alteromonas sp. a30]MCY7296627.1 efflux RND transporter periplasmic adaptor subunit [Alteromonas sp. a30]